MCIQWYALKSFQQILSTDLSYSLLLIIIIIIIIKWFSEDSDSDSYPFPLVNSTDGSLVIPPCEVRRKIEHYTQSISVDAKTLSRSS